MSVDYAKQYSGVVDEKFAAEAKSNDFVNNKFSFVGAKTVSVQSISTAAMNNYNRTGSNRYGSVTDLNVTSQEMTMSKDRSFTFAIDKMDTDETKRALVAGEALARQIREVVIPEIDKYRFEKLVEHAGTKVGEHVLSAENIYKEILKGTEKLDEAEVPEVGRIMAVCPDTYSLMKQSKDIVLDTEIGQELRLKGYVGMIDGMLVKKVPHTRLGNSTNFIITHPDFCCSPVKLAEYKIHTNVPGISGELVEGRVYYDAFVLNNKKKGIYVSTQAYIG